MRSVLPVLAAVFLFPGVACAGGAGAAPAVAVAADLAFALPEIAAAFKRDTGREVKLSFGSSGNFTRQIAEGAPFELFLSADERYVEQLQTRGRADGAGVLYGVGRIVQFVPKGSPVKADPKLQDLAAAAGDGRLKKLAIANPEHAPYGRAAQEALESAGLWARVKERLVLGENASQAAQFASAGGAQAGIIPLSLALAPSLAGRGSHALIPDTMHRPLRQRMVLIRGAGETARAFYTYLQQPEARAVLERYGFTLTDQVQGPRSKDQETTTGVQR
ncbi:MAG TPA: molybdate ABC transporter substrate-binding protein [Burkholderiales bacterium]|nr:molybdate ABC transporter substrate-binding protein [Burkholderiales bacterium]